jgi:hypothetical protein
VISGVEAANAIGPGVAWHYNFKYRQQNDPVRRAASCRMSDLSEGIVMTRAILLSLPLLLLSRLALAANTTGHSALALAGVIAQHSPTLARLDKSTMAALFDGRDPPYPAGRKISVKADSVTCFAGDVSINTFSCALTFDKSTITVTGRRGNEIYATLIEAGVPSSGAAGKIYEAVAQLDCSIDPNAIKQNDGGGAGCSFTTVQ